MTNDLYRDPQRAPYVADRRSNFNSTGWIIGALAVAMLLGLFFFMGSDNRTARTSDPAATTGQNTRAPVPNAGTTQDNVNSPVQNLPTSR